MIYDASTYNEIWGRFASGLAGRNADFAVSCNEVDQLVAIADASTGVLGSRMVGAGFGGCVLSLVESDKIDQASRQIRQRYEDVVGSEPWTHIVRPADPAGSYD